MKNHHLLLSLLCLLLLLPESARAQHELGLGAGYGSGYKLSLDYSFEVVPQWQIQTGLGMDFLSPDREYNDLTSSQAITAPSGLPASSTFYFNTEINHLEEEWDLSFLTIPLLLEYRTGGKHAFYTAAGIKFGIPLSGTYHQRYDRMITSGFSEYTNQTYRDMPALGFSTYNQGASEGDLDLSLAYIAALKMGMKWKLAERVSLTTGLYLDYGLNNSVNNSRDWIEYKTSGQHQLSSIPDSYSPLSYGVELGIRFSIGKSSKKRAGVIIEHTEERLPELAIPVDTIKEPIVSEKRESYEYDMLILLQPVNRYSANQISPTRFQQDILEEKVSILTDYPDIRIVLEGHTHADEENNPKLGMQRAEAAKNYLVSRGIAPERIQVVDKGDDYPVASGDAEEDKPKNRRVEIVLEE